MDSQIRTLVAVDAGVDARAVEDALPVDTIDLIDVVDGMDEGWKVLQETSVDLLVVASSGYSDRALFLIDGARKLDPTRPILVLSQGSPNGFLRRAFEAGAEDIAQLPQTREQIGFAVRKLMARREGSGLASGVKLGRLVIVLGPKGGTGKTLTASNLAVALAEADERVAIVDLDLQFGDIALCLGLTPGDDDPRPRLSGGSLDAEKLDDFLVTHSSGRGRCWPRRAPTWRARSPST